MGSFQIRTYNKISKQGLDRFSDDLYQVSDHYSDADAIVLRSQRLELSHISANVKAIGRAGAGVNNIPIDYCNDQGVVVFNTPGANANAVKELVLAGLLLSARDILNGVNYVRSIQNQGDEVAQLVETNKSRFKGIELQGKRLGVIGLGAIGMMVANVALELGMLVEGYDPFISVRNAWLLSSHVTPAVNLERMLKTCDFVSVHVPSTSETREFINQDKISLMKPGVVLLNFSRDVLVEPTALANALDKGDIGCYVTDFPNAYLAGHEKVIPLPHLGASTKEAEDNCAVMAVDQLKGFLEMGTIKNSVNFPSCELEQSGENRLIVINQNEPTMISQFTSILADAGLNITEMVNKSRDKLAYNILDFNGDPSERLLACIREIPGVIRARLVQVSPALVASR